MPNKIEANIGQLSHQEAALMVSVALDRTIQKSRGSNWNLPSVEEICASTLICADETALENPSTVITNDQASKESKPFLGGIFGNRLVRTGALAGVLAGAALGYDQLRDTSEAEAECNTVGCLPAVNRTVTVNTGSSNPNYIPARNAPFAAPTGPAPVAPLTTAGNPYQSERSVQPLLAIQPHQVTQPLPPVVPPPVFVIPPRPELQPINNINQNINNNINNNVNVAQAQAIAIAQPSVQREVVFMPAPQPPLLIPERPTYTPAPPAPEVPVYLAPAPAPERPVYQAPAPAPVNRECPPGEGPLPDSFPVGGGLLGEQNKQIKCEVATTLQLAREIKKDTTKIVETTDRIDTTTQGIGETTKKTQKGVEQANETLGEIGGKLDKIADNTDDDGLDWKDLLIPGAILVGGVGGGALIAAGLRGREGPQQQVVYPPAGPQGPEGGPGRGPQPPAPEGQPPRGRAARALDHMPFLGARRRRARQAQAAPAPAAAAPAEIAQPPAQPAREAVPARQTPANAERTRIPADIHTRIAEDHARVNGNRAPRRVEAGIPVFVPIPRPEANVEQVSAKDQLAMAIAEIQVGLGDFLNKLEAAINNVSSEDFRRVSLKLEKEDPEVVEKMRNVLKQISSGNQAAIAIIERAQTSEIITRFINTVKSKIEEDEELARMIAAKQEELRRRNQRVS